ncbi:MAG: hypothetical protein ACP59X_23150 [Solidesulfovibrio sp. DCME]|uniref:hypothetical protein n=1 Tax=Solidesulfovibrio sp. DCME TaxID=3447380 RepID=UPI003D105C86
MAETATPDQGGFPWRMVCGMAALVLTLTVMALAQSGHDEGDPAANQIFSGSAFGYADGQGRQVLVPVETGLARGMKGFRQAVAAPGKIVPLTYAGVRTGDEAGGDAAFGEVSGALFAAGSTLGPEGEVLVATDGFLAGRQVLAVTPVAARECLAGLRQALEARAGRAALWCREVAAVEGGGALALARFAPKGRDELATLAYAEADRLVFLDYPATADPGGAWRPDDGGEFPLDGYRPLFAFRTDDGLELAVRVSGGGNASMDLYRQEGDAFVPFVAAAWPRP